MIFHGGNSPSGNFSREKLAIGTLAGESFQVNFSTDGGFPEWFEKLIEIKRKNKSFTNESRLKMILQAELSARSFFGRRKFSIKQKGGFSGIILKTIRNQI